MYYNSPQTPMLIKIPVKLTYTPPDFMLLPKVKITSYEGLYYQATDPSA